VPKPRRALLLLVLLALLLLGFLLWRGSWSDAEFPAARPPAEASGDEHRAATLQGSEGARAGAGGADATDADPFAACPVHGRIVDAETGAPVADAWYYLWPAGWDPPKDPYGSFVDAVEGETECLAEALYSVDPAGRLGFDRSFAYVARGLPLELHAFADGYVPQTVPLEIPGTIEVRLERGLAISGWVVDATRRPVAGAQVRARSDSPLIERLLRPVPHGHVVAWATSGADGGFLLSGLPAEPVWVEASFGTVDTVQRSEPKCLTPGQEESVEIALVDLPHIVLEVRTADGGPMRSARLFWSLLQQDVLWNVAPSEAPTERIVSPLPLPPPPLPARVELVVEGYQTASIPLDGGAGDVWQTVVLEPDPAAGSARLALVWPPDAGDDPVYVGLHATHPALDLLLSGLWAGEWRVVAPGTEEVLVHGLRTDEYQIQALGRRVACSGVSVTVPAAGEGRAELSLQRAGSLEVVFEGAPAIGVAFSLQNEDGLQEHRERERLSGMAEVLPGGLCWGTAFLAVPDGEGRAVGRVLGLVAGPYVVVPITSQGAYGDAIDVCVEPGQTTRVVVPHTR